MNIQSIILTLVIAALVVFVVWRIFRQHTRKHGGCSCCDVEGCSLRELMAKKKKS
ncbi:MAG: FeoB-associated Cys-rich membrane protein [Prevotella sp.]